MHAKSARVQSWCYNNIAKCYTTLYRRYKPLHNVTSMLQDVAQCCSNVTRRCTTSQVTRRYTTSHRRDKTLHAKPLGDLSSHNYKSKQTFFPSLFHILQVRFSMSFLKKEMVKKYDFPREDKDFGFWGIVNRSA